MLEFNEVKIARILNPTSIDLGEYVINPFMGCEYSCLYCYVRSNRVISRKTKPWGEYVDIRVNAPHLLEKEIALRKPKRVLLGSTTECFQPVEMKYGLTRKLLEILNYHKVYYSILTRSPYITEYAGILKAGYCERIYFTINNMRAEHKLIFEPKSPGFVLREEALNILLDEGLPVVPYFSPILPWISDTTGVFLKFKKAKSIEFECLNFRLKNIGDIIDCAGKISPALRADYETMLKSKEHYSRVGSKIEDDIRKMAREANKNYDIYIHNFGSYFENRYMQGQPK